MLSDLRRLSLFAIVLAAVSFPPAAHGQQEPPPATTVPTPEPPHRPRIALALSGGGARGLAHVGVLQWMEENHIPVDSVAGTSMGALVGAVYATGMNTTEMHDFVKTIQWDDVLLREPTYDQLSYRRKQDRSSYQVGAMLGLKHGLNGPNGLSPAHGVGLLIDRIAFPYSTISTFDDLPTPFRCVATDMLTGDAIILHDGSLAESLRATMAIPAVFTPVELNGRFLADGGLVNNIPTDVARSMGADIVIAVDIAPPLGARDKLQTLAGVLDQSLSLMTIDHDRRALQQADIVLAPDLGTHTVFDYESAEEIIRMGYDGAARKAAVLRPFALSDADWQQYVAARDARKRAPQKSASTLEVAGVTGDAAQHIERKLRKILNRDLDLKELDARLTHLVGEGRFDSLGYEGFTQNGVPALRIVAHEKTYGPPFVDLAVNVNGSGTAAFDFSAGLRVTFMDFKNHGGEWRNDLLLGSSNLAATEFYQPIGDSHFFAAPYAFASKTARNAFTGQTRIAIFGDERAGGGFDLGYNSGRRSELRFGYQIFTAKLAPLVGSAGLPRVTGSTGELRLRYVWDSQDSPAVPSSGTRVIATLSRVLQSPTLVHSLDQLDVQTSTFIPTGPKTSLFFNASGGTTFHGTAGPFQVFALGGPFRLGAYLPQEFLGNHYGYAALGFRRDLYHLPQFVGRKIYWGGWYEAGTAFNDPDSVVVRGSVNLGVIAETIVGPIALAGAVSPTGQSRVNFSIGRVF
ncbi:MAG: patatin-like phospholipase family protein [Acidobacteriia bacterium]|nr:patatin-like phospholipase family protein [Terriglobia bacterium]